VRASFKRAFEEIANEDPALIKAAVLRGLRGRPREAFPYVQLGAFYTDGKPADTLQVKGQHATPCVVVLPMTSKKSED
jgi:hypothetical protein